METSSEKTSRDSHYSLNGQRGLSPKVSNRQSVGPGLQRRARWGVYAARPLLALLLDDVSRLLLEQPADLSGLCAARWVSGLVSTVAKPPDSGGFVTQCARSVEDHGRIQ